MSANFSLTSGENPDGASQSLQSSSQPPTASPQESEATTTVVTTSLPDVPQAPAPPPDDAEVEAPYKGLSEVQIKVLRRVIAGWDITHAATCAGVNRGTVHRWHRNPRFAAVLDAWKQRTRQVTRNQLVGLSERCVQVISYALERDDARVAMQLLKHLGMLTPIEDPQVRVTVGTPRPMPAPDSEPEAQQQPGVETEPEAKGAFPRTPRTLKEVRALTKELEAKFGDMLGRPDILPTNRSNK